MGGTGGPHHVVTGAAAPSPVAAVRLALEAVDAGARVVLAVSGGGDSAGMAHLVMRARPDLDAAIVHVRHGLRPDADDVAAASQHATALGLPFEAVTVDVAPDGTGPEAAARTARLDALATAARARRAGFVAVGHTADDQAETVLLNIARGSGLPGLAGMPQQRPLDEGVVLIRPVLELRRATVRDLATATGLPVAQDPTNDDPAQRRARARHTLLPLLSDLTGAGSDPVVALARLAAHARSDTDALDLLAGAEFDRIVRNWGPAVVADAGWLAALPGAVARRVVRAMVQRAVPGPPPSAATVAALLDLRDGQAASLPGGATASRGGGRLAVAAAHAPLPERRVPDAVDLPELGVVLSRRPGRANQALPPWAPASAAAAVPVDPEAAIVVRSRRPGDRIRSAAGSQSVADAMIDAGVPRVVRDLVPVVEDEAGLLWVPGVAVRAGATGSQRLRLTPLRGK